MKNNVIVSDRRLGMRGKPPVIVYRRAALREHPTETRDMIATVSTPIVEFVPAHDYTYRTLDLRSLKTSADRRGHQPDVIRVGSRDYPLEPRTKSAPQVRVMSDDDAAALDALQAEWDRARAEFQRRDADLREEIYARSRKLRIDEIINAKRADPDGDDSRR